MDVSEYRYCASISQCKDSVTDECNKDFSTKSNDLDLIPDSESSNWRCCEVDEVPKVFPKHSRGRHVSLTTSSSIRTDAQQISQYVPCPATGFFQKVMENAKSILNIKCSNIHQANPINEEPTKDTDSCECESDKPWQSTNSTSKAYASLPMRSSSEDCLCDEESTKNDTSADSYSCSVSCSCKNSDEQNKEGEGCNCKTYIFDRKASKKNSYKNVSATKSDDNTFHMESLAKSEPSGSVKSSACFCNNTQINNTIYSVKGCPKSFSCDSSKAVISDKVIQSKIEQCDMSCECAVKVHSTGTKIYNVTNMLGGVPQHPKQVDASVLQKSAVSDKNVETKALLKKSFACVTEPCNQNQKCEFTSCWVNKEIEDMKNRKVGIKNFCNDPVCPVYVSLTKSSTTPNISYGIQVEKRKSVCNIGTCPSAKKLRSRSSFRDKNDQCAFVGSPILKAIHLTTGFGDTKNSCCCNIPNNSRSSQILMMINDMANQEREMKDQLNVLIEREKNYETILNNFQNRIKRRTCCCASQENEPRIDIETISESLKLENKMLKSELMELKLELKHCLEKIQGPMQQRLEIEKAKCLQLQQELSQASQNMMMNQDVYLKEMNAMKMQLCVACSNMTELSTINNRLKGELDALDCMCSKLEDDLVKQKLSEAETIKRLKKRLPTNQAELKASPPNLQVIEPSPQKQLAATTASQDSALCSDSNLHSIARKLSKTLKESAPCEECSKLPSEIKEAAKYIKNLTDMVESRKINKYQMDLIKDCYCQSPPPTHESSSQFTGLRDVGAGVSKTATSVSNQEGEVPTKTLFTVPPSVFMNETTSSHVNVQQSLRKTSPTRPPQTAPEITDSLYFSAQTIDGKSKVIDEVITCPTTKPCIFQIPGTTQDLSERARFMENAVSCTLIGSPCMRDNHPDTEHVQRDDTQKGGDPVDTEIEKSTMSPSRLPEAGPLSTNEKVGEDHVTIPPLEIKNNDDLINSFESPTSPVPAERNIPETSENIKPSLESQYACDEKNITPSMEEKSYSIGGNVDNIRPDQTEMKEVVPVQISHTKPLTGISEGYSCPPSCYLDGVPCNRLDEGAMPVSAAMIKSNLSANDAAISAINDALLKTVKEEPQELQQFLNDAENVDERKTIDEIEGSPTTLQTENQPTGEIVSKINDDVSENELGSINVPDTRSERTTTEGRSDSKDFSPARMSNPLETCSGEGSAKMQDNLNDTDERDISPSDKREREAEKPVILDEQFDNFPFEVETTGIILTEPPPGLILTTTITNSGNLEVITEGPEGIIETELNYREDGVIEVITQITEIADDDRTVRTEGEVSSNITNKSTDSQGLFSKPERRYPVSAKNEFEKQRQELLNKLLASESIRSGASGLTGIDTPLSQVDSLSKPSQATYKSFRTTDPTTDSEKIAYLQTPEIVFDNKSTEVISGNERSEEKDGATAKGKTEMGLQNKISVTFKDTTDIVLTPSGSVDQQTSAVSAVSASATTSDVAEIETQQTSAISTRSAGTMSPITGAVVSSELPPDESGLGIFKSSTLGASVAAEDAPVVSSTGDTLDISKERARTQEVGASVAAEDVPVVSSTDATLDISKETARIQEVGAGVAAEDLPVVSTTGATQDISKEPARTQELAAGVAAEDAPVIITTGVTPVISKKATGTQEVGSGVAKEDASSVSATGVTPVISKEATGTQQIGTDIAEENAPSVTTTGGPLGMSKGATRTEEVGAGVAEENAPAVSTISGTPDISKGATRTLEVDSVIAKKHLPAVSTNGVTPDIRKDATGALEHDVGIKEEYALAVSTSGVIPVISKKTTSTKEVGAEDKDTTAVSRTDVTPDISKKATVLQEVDKRMPPYGIKEAIGGKEITRMESAATEIKEVSTVIQHSQQPVKSQKVDCSCQSSIPIEQSCQCCECKDIGVSTSNDTQTATDQVMTGEKLPRTIIKGDQSTSFHTAGDGPPTLESRPTEESEEPIATPLVGKSHGTSDDISTINEESTSTDQPGQTTSEREELEQYESAREMSLRNLREVEISKDTGDAISESFTQQTDQLSYEKRIGSGKIRDPFQNAVKNASISAKKSSAQSSGKETLAKGKPRGSSEVPDSVSRLSDRAMPPFSDSSETKRARKKRSSKLGDSQCQCSGICQCVVCSTEVLRRRKEMTGTTDPPPGSPYKLCCFTPPTSHNGVAEKLPLQTENVHMQTQMQPLNGVGPLEQGPGYLRTEAFLKSTNLDNPVLPYDRQRVNIDDVFNEVVNQNENNQKTKSCRANEYAKNQLTCDISCPKPSTCIDACELLSPFPQRLSHPSNCECVDCLCFPTIQEIAQTVEFPFINDEKQIYQVQTMKCSCPNAKRYLERSRIPIPTNSRTSPPSAPTKHDPNCDCNTCQCNPCADPSKRATEPYKKPEIFDLSKLCDCGDCKCVVCYNKPPKTGEKIAKGTSDKKCCCRDGCVCEICLVDDLQKKLDEVSRQLNEQVSKMSKIPSAISKIPEKSSKISEKTKSQIPEKGSEVPIVHPNDCDCYECICPVPMDDPEMPTTPLEISQTPTEITDQLPQETDTSHPNDCDCYECKCVKVPLSAKASKMTEKQPELVQHKVSAIASTKTAEPEIQQTTPPHAGVMACDCPDCVCGPCADPNKKNDTQKSVPCDCTECICNPCADPEKRKQAPKKAPMEAVSARKHLPEDCTCEICLCEGGGVGGGKRRKAAEEIDEPCTCELCECPGKESVGARIGDFDVGHQDGCTCEVCECPGKDQATKVHQEDCTCEVCECPGKDQVRKGGMVAAVGTRDNKETHPIDCICPECRCEKGDIYVIVPEGGDTGMGGKEDKETHPADCICDKCLCEGAKKHEKGCCCLECKCIECNFTTETCTHSLGCRCEECTGEKYDMQKTTDGTQMPTSTSSRFGGVGDARKIQDSPYTNCKCTECYYKVELAKPTPTCKCEPCLCQDCLLKKEMKTSQSFRATTPGDPVKPGENCHCADCCCDVCASKVGKGSSGNKEMSAKVSVVDRASEICEIEKGCKCSSCVCIDCVGEKTAADRDVTVELTTSQRMKPEQTGTKGLLPPGHNPNCKCVTCSCKDCSSGFHPTVLLENTCKCEECLCVDCSWEKEKVQAIQDPITQIASELASAHQTQIQGKRSEMKDNKSQIQKQQCKCNICDCTDCKVGTEEKNCNCHMCNCIDCIFKKKLLGTGISSDTREDVEYQSRAYDTRSDTRKDVEYQSRTDDTRSDTRKDIEYQSKTYDTQQMDPPPFEVPIRKQCDCKPCTCVICTDSHRIEPRIEARTQQTVSYNLGKTDTFEVPISIGCDCPICKCSICNKDLLRTKVILQSEPTIPNQPAERSDMRSVSATTGSRGRSPVHCNCPTCACPSDPVNSVPSKPSTVKGAYPQDYGICTCDDNEAAIRLRDPSSHVSGKQSQASGKQSHVSGKSSHASEKLSSTPERLTSASHPNPCLCSECSCTEEITKLIYGKQSTNDPYSTSSEKSSKKNVNITGTPNSSRQASRLVSGKSLHVSGPHVTESHVSEQQITPTGYQVTEIVSRKTEKVSVEVSYSLDIETGASGKLSSRAEGDTPQIISDNLIQKRSQTDKNVSDVKSSMSPLQAISTRSTNECCTDGCNKCSKLESIDISKLDDHTLIKKIETDKKENCECREQIREIRRALNKIKCACTEAEIKAGKNKPFVKQASAFGQTMSGLKLALHNLQEKCKAKDKMIEAMTGELKSRTSSNTLNKVLNTSLPDVLDYDRAKDVISLEPSRNDPVPTNVLYSLNEEREFEAKLSKAMSSEKRKARPKSSRVCKCGKSHRDRDSLRVSLSGYEIIDIRRITHDSIIIKWKSPKSNLVTGYDIFVNGVHKSKVMSGGRTSAMIHSLDLSATIQITIYAVTRCGRCEPPAIAIYEIK